MFYEKLPFMNVDFYWPKDGDCCEHTELGYRFTVVNTNILTDIRYIVCIVRKPDGMYTNIPLQWFKEGLFRKVSHV